MLIGSNPKKNEDPVALMEATPDIEFDHGVSRHVEILQMSENSVAARMRIYGKFSSEDRPMLM
jgi:hypothetical protein